MVDNGVFGRSFIPRLRVRFDLHGFCDRHLGQDEPAPFMAFAGLQFTRPLPFQARHQLVALLLEGREPLAQVMVLRLEAFGLRLQHGFFHAQGIKVMD